jgi:hypothetical protein
VAGKVEGMQARHQPGRAQPGRRVGGINRAERAGRRIVGRKRRAQSLHPSAFLIDEDRRIRPADALT